MKCIREVININNKHINNKQKRSDTEQYVLS